MILDSKLKVSDAQAVTASAASTSYIDRGAAGDVGNSCPLYLLITVNIAAAAAGAATVNFQLQCDDNSSFSSAKTVIQTDAIAKADLIVGKQIVLPLPPGLDERYLRLYYLVTTGPLTAGAFSAQITSSLQSNQPMPDAI